MATSGRAARIIDVATARTSDELHALIADRLSFPDYYGRNWDAFDECIREVAAPISIEIQGLSALRFVLPREAELLEECFADAAASVPGLEVRFHVV